MTNVDDFHQTYSEIAGALRRQLSDLEYVKDSILEVMGHSSDAERQYDKLLHLDFIHDKIVTLKQLIEELEHSRAKL